jgi:hypothetical protein
VLGRIDDGLTAHLLLTAIEIILLPVSLLHFSIKKRHPVIPFVCSVINIQLSVLWTLSIIRNQ